LYLIFRDWRARYRERAMYGATQVVPAINPLEAIVPANVKPVAWRDAVSQTRAMLMTVTSSNLLDVKEMQKLRTELDQSVRRAQGQPETACRELAGVWDAIGERAEFLLKDGRSESGDRHPRPKILPPYGATRVAPAIDPMAEIVPPGVEPGAWRDAVSQTHEMLLALTGSNLLTIGEMKALRARLDEFVARARAHPETAPGILATLRNQIADRDEFLNPDSRSKGGDRRPRPKILRPL
jgi:hypothetical protein